MTNSNDFELDPITNTDSKLMMKKKSIKEIVHYCNYEPAPRHFIEENLVADAPIISVNNNIFATKGFDQIKGSSNTENEKQNSGKSLFDDIDK